MTDRIDQDQKSSPRRRMSPVLKLVLGTATVLTLGFAAVSAWAVHSEPAVRVADEADASPSKSIAVAVSQSWKASQSRRATDVGATSEREYLIRADGLARSL